MSTLRKLMLGLVLAALCVASLPAPVAAQDAAREAMHCHASLVHPADQAPSCCKVGHCDCSHAGALSCSALPAPGSYHLAGVAARITVGLQPPSIVRVFRPPII